VAALEWDDLAAAAGEPVPEPAPEPPPVPPAASGESSHRVWERVPICPGVELHVRLDADVGARKIALTIEETFGTSARNPSR
jgi:hypothetical protein